MINTVELVGEVIKEPTLNEEIKGERIYVTVLRIPRLCQRADELVIRISERFTAFPEVHVGTKLRVTGSIRTRNVHEQNTRHTRLELTVFCLAVDALSEDEYKPRNVVRLEGVFGKTPYLRKAKTSDRKLCEQLIRSVRNYGRVSYIPTVFWGRTAEYVSTLNKGTHVMCEGRLQSREYIKGGALSNEVNPVRGITYEFCADTIMVQE